MEEILNNWLQEKPKDKFDKELHKYTYYDLMEFAEHYHTLQLQQTGVMASCNIDLVGKELEYISPITEAKTKFKVADVFVNIFNVGLKERMVYGEVFAVSENGNKYKIDEFSEVRIPQ